ncbi:MAG: hypothetical protein GC161_11420 [Planctomycetaceae bacterium]|nr:hypothetical protein [Planctomycetaceae bacterium]
MSRLVPSILPSLVVLSLVGGGAVAQMPCEVLRIENPLAPADGAFGNAVAISGDRMVVGMYGTGVAPDVGSAYVFDRDGASWTQSAQLTIPDGINGAYFGWSVAVDGDVALVGRRGDGQLLSKGAVYVFQRASSGTWSQTQKLVPPAPEAWAFGWSISLDGTRVAIGSKGAGSAGPKGRVFVYELEDGQFVLKQKLVPSLDNLSDWFGHSVALQGDRIAVGANKGGTGRAYVFDRQESGTWVQSALLLPPDLSSADEYGYAVALDGDRVAVSAPGHDIPWGNHGGIYIFERDPQGAWQQAAKLSVFAGSTFPRFGWSMDLSGDVLFAGAPEDGEIQMGAGKVHVFRRIDETWTHDSVLHGSEPVFNRWFGNSVRRSGDWLAVGAPAHVSPQWGRVHMFSLAGLPTLSGATIALSNNAGGVQPLQLGACQSHAGDFYLILGSISGAEPALPLGSVAVPLVPDFYTQFTLSQPNSALLPASIGQLDPWGRAYASFELPPASPPSTIGLTVHHAFLVLDQTTLALESASNAVPVTIGP